MAQAPADPVADHGVADGLRHDEAGARRGVGTPGRRRLVDKQVYDHGAPADPSATANCCGEVVTTPQSMRRGQHDYLGISGTDSVGSGRQLVATLAAAGGQDRATGTGAHAQPEAVGLRTTAVV